MTELYSLIIFDWCSSYKCCKIGNVYSMQYTDISKVFFTPHHVLHCSTNAKRGYTSAVSHSSSNIIRGCNYAPVRSNEGLSAHCWATAVTNFCIVAQGDTGSWRLPTPMVKPRQTNRQRLSIIWNLVLLQSEELLNTVLFVFYSDIFGIFPDWFSLCTLTSKLDSQAFFPNVLPFVLTACYYCCDIRYYRFSLISSLCSWNVILYPVTALRKRISAVFSHLSFLSVSVQHSIIQNIGNTITVQTFGKIPRKVRSTPTRMLKPVYFYVGYINITDSLTASPTL
jgi:hypothetical protein